MATDYYECGICHVRTLLVRGIPVLDWGRDPGGKVAVTITHPRTGRFLAEGEQATSLEHRHNVHACERAEQ